MRRDDDVVVLGEDIGKAGGVFRATEGLLDEFGPGRVLDTPLAENGIVGTAIGMALYGLRPVAEIQFSDFIFPAFDQVVSEAAKMRYRSNGQYAAPIVVRAPVGGGIKGGLYHSQSPEAYFAHTAGLVVVSPSTPSDAKGLLLSALLSPDPVMFLEPKRLYRTAAEASSASVEVLDLRTLLPLDVDAVLASVRKTGRCVIVHEAPRTCGYGAELAAIVAERALGSLLGPIARVAGFDTPFPYTLEHVYLPEARRVEIGRATCRGKV